MSGQFAGHADDRDFEIALFEHLDHLRRAGVDHLHLDARMLRLEPNQQVGDQLRTDRAHRADRQRRLLELLDRPRLVARRAAAFLDGLQIGQHHPPKLGQMRVAALAVEQRPAQLMLELLDRAGQRRLADVALLGGAREIERARQGDEIADLLHFHGRESPSLGLNFLTPPQRNPPVAVRYRLGMSPMRCSYQRSSFGPSR